LLLAVLGSTLSCRLEIRLEKSRFVVYNCGIQWGTTPEKSDGRYTLIRFFWNHWDVCILVVFLLEGELF
jgi:hypothetical protein